MPTTTPLLLSALTLLAPLTTAQSPPQYGNATIVNNCPFDAYLTRITAYGAVLFSDRRMTPLVSHTESMTESSGNIYRVSAHAPGNPNTLELDWSVSSGRCKPLPPLPSPPPLSAKNPADIRVTGGGLYWELSPGVNTGFEVLGVDAGPLYHPGCDSVHCAANATSCDGAATQANPYAVHYCEPDAHLMVTLCSDQVITGNGRPDPVK